MIQTWQRAGEAQGSFRRVDFRPVLTLIGHTGIVLTSRVQAHHSLRQSLSSTWPRPGWAGAGALALLSAASPGRRCLVPVPAPIDERQQWQALSVAPLSGGGVERHADGADRGRRAGRFRADGGRCCACRSGGAAPMPVTTGPLRIRGRVGDGLYWSLRAAGASPEVAAQYLSALATEIDVGEVARRWFDLFSARTGAALRGTRSGRGIGPAAGALVRQWPKRMDRCRQRRATGAG